MGNVLQNKGGIGAYLRVDRTTFLFVAAHLAAHQACFLLSSFVVAGLLSCCCCYVPSILTFVSQRGTKHLGPVAKESDKGPGGKARQQRCKLEHGCILSTKCFVLYGLHNLQSTCACIDNLPKTTKKPEISFRCSNTTERDLGPCPQALPKTCPTQVTRARWLSARRAPTL